MTGAPTLAKQVRIRPNTCSPYYTQLVSNVKTDILKKNRGQAVASCRELSGHRLEGEQVYLETYIFDPFEKIHVALILLHL